MVADLLQHASIWTQYHRGLAVVIMSETTMRRETGWSATSTHRNWRELARLRRPEVWVPSRPVFWSYSCTRESTAWFTCMLWRFHTKAFFLFACLTTFRYGGVSAGQLLSVFGRDTLSGPFHIGKCIIVCIATIFSDMWEEMNAQVRLAYWIPVFCSAGVNGKETRVGVHGSHAKWPFSHRDVHYWLYHYYAFEDVRTNYSLIKPCAVNSPPGSIGVIWRERSIWFGAPEGQRTLWHRTLHGSLSTRYPWVLTLRHCRL